MTTPFKFRLQLFQKNQFFKSQIPKLIDNQLIFIQISLHLQLYQSFYSTLLYIRIGFEFFRLKLIFKVSKDLEF